MASLRAHVVSFEIAVRAEQRQTQNLISANYEIHRWGVRADKTRSHALSALAQDNRRLPNTCRPGYSLRASTRIVLIAGMRKVRCLFLPRTRTSRFPLNVDLSSTLGE